MPLVVLTGGARSGKSALAQRLAGSSDDVVVIATGDASDDEMAARIAAHRAARPRVWATVEEPIALPTALAGAPEGSCVIVDCLTLWVANLLGRGLSDDDVIALSSRALEVVAARSGRTIAVTNEVGSGIVPVNALARRYRDLLGRVNAAWVAAAETPLLVVAGRVLPLRDLDEPAGE